MKNQVHVVVFLYPSQGHINPLLQFAKRLVSKGVKATVATTHYTVNFIYAPNVTVEPIFDGFEEGGFALQEQDEAAFLKTFQINGSKTLSDLIRKYEDSTFPISCVVYDAFLPWVLDVAKSHSIFGAPFFTNSAASCAIFSRIHHDIVRLPVEEDQTPLILPGLPPLNLLDLPTFVHLPKSYPAYLATKRSQSNLEKADWIFANSFVELEGEAVKAVSDLWPGRLIGPMVPSAYLDGRIKDDEGYGASLWNPLGEENCTKWLGTKPFRSVVYVSFGSIVSLTAEEMEEMASALKESEMSFIWVVRESERVKLTYDFVNCTKNNGLIVNWCNQLEILAHRAVACFVTHCGWNSTLEGLSLGVPMIGLPKWGDQLTNAKFIEEIWDVGVRAKEDENGVVRREELLWCLKQVTEGERSVEVRSNASRWKRLANEAISEGGSSDKRINEFVEHLKCGSSTSKIMKNKGG